MNKADDGQEGGRRRVCGPDSLSSTLFVSNFPRNWNETDLTNLFGRFDKKIVKAVIKRNVDGGSKKYGFIQFEKEEDAIRVYAIVSCDGLENVRVGFADQKEIKTGKAREQKRGRDGQGGSSEREVRRGQETHRAAPLQEKQRVQDVSRRQERKDTSRSSQASGKHNTRDGNGSDKENRKDGPGGTGRLQGRVEFEENSGRRDDGAVVNGNVGQLIRTNQMKRQLLSSMFSLMIDEFAPMVEEEEPRNKKRQRRGCRAGQ